MPRTVIGTAKPRRLVALALLAFSLAVPTQAGALAATKVIAPQQSTCSTSSSVGKVQFQCTLVRPYGFTITGVRLQGTAFATWKLSCPGSQPVSGSRQDLAAAKSDALELFDIPVNTKKTPRLGALLKASPVCGLAVTATADRSVLVFVNVYDRDGAHLRWSAKTA